MSRIPDSVRTRWERLGETFLERVRKGYLSLASKHSDRFTVIDGTKPLEEVQNLIREELLKRFKQWGSLIQSTDRSDQ
jgi:thymidylate kinase